MPGLSLGFEGSERLFPSGLDRPLSILVEAPPGAEKDVLLLQYVAQGLQTGEGVLVVLATKSPRRLLRELERLGIDIAKAGAGGRFLIVDWYSHREETVASPSTEGPVMKVPGELSSLSGALAGLIHGEHDLSGGRAAVDFITPALTNHSIEEVIPVVAEVRGVIQTLGMACVMAVDREAHDLATLEAIRLNADGVVAIERQREGQGFNRQIRLSSLKGTSVPGPSLALEVTKAGLLRVPPERTPVAAAPPAPVPSAPPSPPVKPPPPTPHPQKVEVQTALQQGLEEDIRQKLPCAACGTPLEPEAELCYVCGTPVPKQDAGRIRTLNILRNAERRLKAEPRNTDLLFVKSVALAKLKDYRAAVAALNEVTKIDPLYPGLWIFKAKLYSRLGDANMARLCRRRALELEGTKGVPPEGAAAEPPGEPQKFQCPNCRRWLDITAASCPCGAEFEEA